MQSDPFLSLRKSIRKQIRQLRQNLSPEQQSRFAQQVAQNVVSHPKIQQANKVALYLSFDGELDTRPLIQQLWQQNKQVYLPVLHPFNQHHLLFLHYHAETSLNCNRFNIEEPPLDVRQVLPVSELDVMFIPLVAFDSTGQRLGMGGGFYDRTLAKWQQQNFYPIGLAHDFQLVNLLPSASWDIPLPEIITPEKIWRW
ncbi:5-formyltetrahydrofolate cyclo-ligase [Xenorhabdus bovienii]|uniref:5-formyltetrahydrofolate cyclo-ligase n=1 Tax=Xenorhabdus bovienii str. Intermedium TaxID=1379677 RepID=A0A077QKR0_XENBV|nr:5-formyltetrahydrofolate cyclo-ligase [Xenorhabdus bovienii]MDE1482679.1 5-formyltetrahydrofolate cyclo-ligase [Xenorhabdus bovienii]MDE9445906.1 5-formyltetrahydrofolate cyclo-ligase [Xenorhabdus bovienii]MDE9458621.1 5-formyltetrahydrofolate cyclo-ligase [Xenorhabdus bovienii]MDE9460228.1 5-formyltetrahydrofolate cyclo-ligase [Xenorhabdus bovienii]MDE9465313.1 5-formyltetrahydrofolate cyclo-ligase [Xenorhabdus bovienii]